eukprot:1203970-Pleurochrysis_carterae.AAC.2
MHAYANASRVDGPRQIVFRTDCPQTHAHSSASPCARGEAALDTVRGIEVQPTTEARVECAMLVEQWREAGATRTATHQQSLHFCFAVMAGVEVECELDALKRER